MRAVIVTNIPTPYRVPVYDLVLAAGVDLHVLYMAARERNRHWRMARPATPSTVLPSRVLAIRGRYVHLTTGVWRRLSRLQPDVVVTTGFNPPQLVAVLWCVLHAVPHVAQTDGTPESEAVLTPVHRLVRRVVSRRTAEFVAASRAGERLLRQWGAPADRLHRSALAVDNAVYAARADDEKDVDLLFSGQLSEVKDPLFAVDVAARTATLLGRPVVLAVVGDGPLREAVRARAAQVQDAVRLLLPGFQQQESLPRWYGRSRVFLFPTHWDPWGLVLNEAAAAGVPAIVSPFAGSGHELVQDGVTGFVRPLDVDAWAEAAASLLGDADLRERTGSAGREVVAEYTYRAAAEGIVEALTAARTR